MPTFNSCTKSVASLGIIHDRTPDFQPDSWAWMSSRLDVALIRTLRGSLMCSNYFFNMSSMGVLYNQTLADVRSIGAVIKCLCCTKQSCDYLIISLLMILVIRMTYINFLIFCFYLDFSLCIKCYYEQYFYFFSFFTLILSFSCLYDVKSQYVLLH